MRSGSDDPSLEEEDKRRIQSSYLKPYGPMKQRFRVQIGGVATSTPLTKLDSGTGRALKVVA